MKTPVKPGQAELYAELPDRLREAVLLHKAGNLEQAFPLYKEFLSANPNHPMGLQMMGLLYSQVGEFPMAIALMRESLRLFPGQAEVANNLGNALSRSGSVDEAIRSYHAAIELIPDYYDAHRNVGLAYLRVGKTTQAKASFERCLSIRPKDADAWFCLGNAHRELHDYDSGIECFEKALKYRPKFSEALHNLGLCQRLSHRPEEAIQNYRAARSLGLDRAVLFHNLGNALIDNHETAAAIEAFKEALARDPGDLDSHRNLNAILWQSERDEEYLESYREALARSPDAEDLRIAYAVALNQLENYGKAEQVLREGMRLSPHSSEIRSLLAYTLEGLGNWDDALATHAEAVGMPQALPNHLVSYARALLACGRPDDALRHVERAAVQMPFNQRALAYLGLCWRLLDDERDKIMNDYDVLIRVFDLPVPAAYDDIGAFNTKLCSVLDKMHIFTRHPADQTLRGGVQTAGNLFDSAEPEIKALVDALKVCVEEYIEGLPYDLNHPLFARRSDQFEFSASWSVRLGQSGFHQMHIHPLGWISSAYYVQVPNEVALSSTDAGGLKFGEPDIDIGDAGVARRRIRPEAGKLILFPSYMWHGTIPFDSNEPRVTVAFDVIPGSK